MPQSHRAKRAQPGTRKIRRALQAPLAGREAGVLVRRGAQGSLLNASMNSAFERQGMVAGDRKAGYPMQHDILGEFAQYLKLTLQRGGAEW